ncbi:uncharacterized protein LAJ45_07594 [Morchella importuna]|uniref:uncharacterized protein n=1 Tax=Morchella importuna TaxID=1174673 RepID=UPI001E8E1E39|nr:uncharacterized protein LAJ45_07594 [Morchella importuna]KAH8148491.1 hypothetical protein LAJ45_07594 [Morchella importuna]
MSVLGDDLGWFLRKSGVMRAIEEGNRVVLPSIPIPIHVDSFVNRICLWNFSPASSSRQERWMQREKSKVMDEARILVVSWYVVPLT